jgi:hypothetical protein
MVIPFADFGGRPELADTSFGAKQGTVSETKARIPYESLGLCIQGSKKRKWVKKWVIRDEDA